MGTEIPASSSASLDPGPQRTLDPRLLLRTGAHDDADDDVVGRQRLDAEHVGLVEDEVAEMPHRAGRCWPPPDHLDRGVDIGVVRGSPRR